MKTINIVVCFDGAIYQETVTNFEDAEAAVRRLKKFVEEKERIAALNETSI